MICLAAGLQGYLLREAPWWERGALLVAAILLIKPGYITDAIGLALLALGHHGAKTGGKALIGARRTPGALKQLILAPA